MGAIGEGLLEELEAVGDLLRGVNVERCAVFGGESGEVCSVAVEEAVAIEEGAGAGLCLGGGRAIFFRQDLDALCGKRVRGFGDDDPGGDVGDDADTGEEMIRAR